MRSAASSLLNETGQMVLRLRSLRICCFSSLGKEGDVPGVGEHIAISSRQAIRMNSLNASGGRAREAVLYFHD
jgi:hypothetical protein